mmetsp:Transcript_12576/g.18855  ORF Transcript_12576/g.18855 Transcript_12576/m.18855 type:complete len:178 (+) Transcript_12576:201-734(+)
MRDEEEDIFTWENMIEESPITGKRREERMETIDGMLMQQQYKNTIYHHQITRPQENINITQYDRVNDYLREREEEKRREREQCRMSPFENRKFEEGTLQQLEQQRRRRRRKLNGTEKVMMVGPDRHSRKYEEEEKANKQHMLSILKTETHEQESMIRNLEGKVAFLKAQLQHYKRNQ